MILNAGVALYAANVADSIGDGITRARAAICERGRKEIARSLRHDNAIDGIVNDATQSALSQSKNMLDRILATKRDEVSQRADSTAAERSSTPCRAAARCARFCRRDQGQAGGRIARR